MGDIKETMSNYQHNTGLNTHRNHGIEHLPGSMEGHNFEPWQDESASSDHLLQTSTNVFVYANDAMVGMIQSFTVNESRNINKLQAIGYEGVVQAVPSNTNGGSLQVSRIALYESNLWGALGLTTTGAPHNPVGSKVHNGSSKPWQWDTYEYQNDPSKTQRVSSGLVFKTLKDQRVPIEIQTRTPKNGTRGEYFIERYVDCWLSSFSKSYSVGTITVAENATIQYSDVY